MPVSAMRTSVVIVLHCLALTGCAGIVHPTPYPADWPQRTQLTGCEINGAYQDLGALRAITITSPKQRLAHLSSLLREGGTGAFNDVSNQTIHLWLDRASPRMRVGSGSSIEPESLRSEGSVVCESDGALTLRFESVTARSYRHAKVTVWSATDGSLIVRLGLNFTQKGLPMLPSNHEVVWSRFQRAEP